TNGYQLDSATTEAQLQQLAKNLNTSEQEQLLEQADLTPEAIAQILAQLQQQQALQQPQAAQPVAATDSMQAIVANAVGKTQPQGQADVATPVTSVITSATNTITAAALTNDNAVSTKPLEPLTALAPVATSE